MIDVQPAIPDDCGRLAKIGLREADLAEIQAASGLDAESALAAGYSSSDPCFTGFVDEEPVCMFGVIPDGNVGYVWLMGTDKIRTSWRDFLRKSKRALPELAEGYDYLANYIDERNELHLRWLDWLGARFHFIVTEYGFEHRPFVYFTYHV